LTDSRPRGQCPQSPLWPSYLARSYKDSRSSSSPRCQVSNMVITVRIPDAPRRTPALWRARALRLCSSRNTRISTRNTYLHRATAIIDPEDHRAWGNRLEPSLHGIIGEMNNLFHGPDHDYDPSPRCRLLGAETWHKVESHRCMMFRSPTTLVKQNFTNTLPTAHNPAHVSMVRKAVLQLRLINNLVSTKMMCTDALAILRRKDFYSGPATP
jgi:hypothetical protein